MSYHARRNGRQQPKAKPRRQSLQKPNGVISPRVRKVGGEHLTYFGADDIVPLEFIPTGICVV